MLEAGDGLVIVNEQLAEFGGAERIIDALVERFPAARLIAPHFDTTNLPEGRTAPLSAWGEAIGPGGRRSHFLARRYARLMAAVPLDGARVVLSIGSGVWAHAVTIPSGARHIAFAHGLPRYLYGHTRSYLRQEPAALRPLLACARPVQRRYYRAGMRRPDRLLCASAWSARRLEEVHGRPWEVVHPPVRTDWFTPPEQQARGPQAPLVFVGRVVRHKRPDVVVAAARELARPVVIGGGGRLTASLERSAPANVRVTGFLEETALRDLYRRAFALVCPNIEEFGIVMAEAQASGLPVIAPCEGGAAEIVRDGETGVLLDRVTPLAIAAAVRELERRPADPSACRASGARFATKRFIQGIEDVVGEESERAGTATRGIAPVP